MIMSANRSCFWEILFELWLKSPSLVITGLQKKYNEVGLNHYIKEANKNLEDDKFNVRPSNCNKWIFMWMALEQHFGKLKMLRLKKVLNVADMLTK